jgi:hypothetical protein
MLCRSVGRLIVPGDRELWACANEVIRQHGAAAPEFIAERIGAMVLANDLEGMRVWNEIARRAADMMITPST